MFWEAVGGVERFPGNLEGFNIVLEKSTEAS